MSGARIEGGIDRAEEWADVFDRAAKEWAEQQALALEEKRFRDSLESMFTSLIWRTISLALRLDIAKPQINRKKVDPIELAQKLRSDAWHALQTLTPTDDKADRFHKVRSINDVLRAILDVVGAMKAYTGVDPNEPFFLAVMGTRLGQAEVELGFAEQGFWEQIATWRDRTIGRPKGSGAAWHDEAAKVIQPWIDADPNMKGKVLNAKVWEWIEDYAAKNRDFKKIDEDSIPKILRLMNDKKLITLRRMRN